MTSGSATFESVEISKTSAAVRVAGGGRSGPEAERGGGVQEGGVVRMDGGSVRFKGGSIARSTAVVRDPRCCQLCVLHKDVAWGALYVAWCVMLAACFAAHGARTLDVAWLANDVAFRVACCMLRVV
jgi:hypothetical protein